MIYMTWLTLGDTKAKIKNTMQALKYPSADAVTLYARFQGN